MINYAFSLQELEYFLLIMVRVTCFIYIAPFYGMNNTPGRVKIGLGFFISLLVYNMLLPHEPVSYQTLLMYTVMILKEAATGLLVGLGANLCTYIVAFSGSIIDMEIGFGMATQMDPTTKQQTSITGVYLQYITMLMLIITGMHRYILEALIETYTLIPINGMIINTDKLLASFITFMGDYLVVGFRICLPVFAVTLILNAVLGILAKVAPQMNMFAVGLQLKVLTGLGVLFVTVVLMPDIANFIFIQMKRTIVSFVEAMM